MSNSCSFNSFRTSPLQTSCPRLSTFTSTSPRSFSETSDHYCMLLHILPLYSHFLNMTICVNNINMCVCCAVWIGSCWTIRKWGSMWTSWWEAAQALAPTEFETFVSRFVLPLTRTTVPGTCPPTFFHLWFCYSYTSIKCSFFILTLHCLVHCLQMPASFGDARTRVLLSQEQITRTFPSTTFFTLHYSSNNNYYFIVL